MMTSPPISDRPLEYANPAQTYSAGNLKRTLRIALGCAVAPAVIGTTVTAVWLVVRLPFLPLLGLLNIGLGGVLFLVGTGLIINYSWRSHRAKLTSARNWIRPAAIVLGLLLLNFPLCAACFELASWSRIYVFNKTSTPVTGFVVSNGSGRTWQLGTIAPNSSVSKLLWFSDGGTIDFSATANGSPVSETMPAKFGQIANDRVVTFKAAGTVHFHIRRKP
jgi:hypothetical protein